MEFARDREYGGRWRALAIHGLVWVRHPLLVRMQKCVMLIAKSVP